MKKPYIIIKPISVGPAWTKPSGVDKIIIKEFLKIRDDSNEANKLSFVISDFILSNISHPDSHFLVVTTRVVLASVMVHQ